MGELTRGQTQELEATRLRVGLGWDKIRTAGALSGFADADLDASAVQFANGELFDLAFYNHLRTRDGSVEHLGDNKTGNGEGDDETITIDLAKVHGPVDTIFLLVSSYQGHSLEWIAGAYCRLVDEHDTEIARVTLTLGVPETGALLAKLVRSQTGWTLHAIAEGIAVKLPTESPAKLKRFL